MSFQQFENDFQKWAADLIQDWANEAAVKAIPVHIVPAARLDPYEVGPVYIMREWKHSGLTGPAILFPEEYLSDLYLSATVNDKMVELWDSLKWSLGHEFGHCSGIIPNMIAPATVSRSLLIRRTSEVSASLYAFGYTGKTRQQHNMEFMQITGMHPIRYLATKYLAKRKQQTRD